MKQRVWFDETMCDDLSWTVENADGSSVVIARFGEWPEAVAAAIEWGAEREARP